MLVWDSRNCFRRRKKFQQFLYGCNESNPKMEEEEEEA
jgi:hypothetical protein